VYFSVTISVILSHARFELSIKKLYEIIVEAKVKYHEPPKIKVALRGTDEEEKPMASDPR